MNIVQDRLKSYSPRSKLEELGALKEIYQEIALAALARSEFFKKGAFQGGTALRIVHRLPRFSEDLDFVLFQEDPSFQWKNYLNAIEQEFQSFGIAVHVKERNQFQGAVRTAFLKENSFGKILELTYDRLPSDERTIAIKFEVDTNPPRGSDYESNFLTYPYPFSIITQDLPSLFATKCHAILCRKYEKGRDWFDFVWYLSREIPLNRILLQNALEQSGPYKEKQIELKLTWLQEELSHKISSLDWKKVALDVDPFLKPEDRRQTENWSADLFRSLTKRIRFS